MLISYREPGHELVHLLLRAAVGVVVGLARSDFHSFNKTVMPPTTKDWPASIPETISTRDCGFSAGLHSDDVDDSLRVEFVNTLRLGPKTFDSIER